MPEEKTLCQTPTHGKQGVRIPRWKYQAVRACILSTLADKPGLPFKDLSQKVAARLDPKARAELGSVGWHVTTVKLDLEAKGEIRRAEGGGLQRLFLAE
ncbi:MAG: hypothetical protein JJT99_00845 [Rhodobacteraceae bacterium]|nr:hypothetical protein [Paracoccaceae bacterium]